MTTHMLSVTYLIVVLVLASMVVGLRTTTELPNASNRKYDYETFFFRI